MKRLILTLVALGTIAAVPVMAAGKQDKKKKVKNPAQTRVYQLKTPNDTLSFVAGIAATNGLNDYLHQQYNLDSAQMAVFNATLEEALLNRKDPILRAKSVAYQIAETVMERAYPSTESQFASTQRMIHEAQFVDGFIASLHNDTALYTADKAVEYLNTAAKEAQAQANKEWIAQNQAWLEENKTKEGVQTTASGLQYKVIKMGDGVKPTESDEVEVKYEGKDIQGKIFDSSYRRNPQTTTFGVNQVIKGWSEALQLMPEGSKFELYIPAELAYGERTAGTIRPNSALIFTVELISVKKQQAEAPAETKVSAKDNAVKKAKTAVKGKKK